MAREYRMPEQVRLGQHMSATVGHALFRYKQWKEDPAEHNPADLRTVMGFPLPAWQRPLVWTDAQCIKFIESAWLGLPLGTYSYNQLTSYRDGRRLDGLLIDGQQRMWAIQQYIDGVYPVFGLRWPDLTKQEHREFEFSRSFGCFITATTDEAYLRSYYDLMNFGGTAHTAEQRATA